MPKGKPWTAQEEAKLRQMVEAGETAGKIAVELGKTEHAVYEKAKRLGLDVIISKRRKLITFTEIELPKELPSVEEALKILAGALKAAVEPGLNRVEVQRLQAIANLARTYKGLLADYVNYREIEAKLVEMEAKYAEFAKKLAEKTEGDASKPNIA